MKTLKGLWRLARKFVGDTFLDYFNIIACDSERMKRPIVDLLADEEDWAAILKPALCQDAAAVECLARVLFTIKRAIESGPEGAIMRLLKDGEVACVNQSRYAEGYTGRAIREAGQ